MGCIIYSKNAVNLEIKIFPADCNNLMRINSGLVDSKSSGLNYSRKPVAVSTPFVYGRSDFFVSKLHLIQSSRVPFDTAIEFALCAKTFPQSV